jgi:glutamate-1-semialdehyde 2,1-aminomutase
MHLLAFLEDANAGAVDSAAAAATAARLAPDLHCLCKALANGHPLAALVGSAASRDAAASVTATGTYWLAPAPMAAALATLDALASNDCAALRHTQRVGSELSTGLLDLAQSHDFAVTMSGPAAMTFLTFDADDDDANAGNSGHHHGASRPRGEAFCAAWASEGVWAHPHHNWYLSAAHSEKDISFALDAADRAFRAVAAMETTI